MDTNSQSTAQRNVFYSLLILAIAACVVAVIFVFVSTDQGQDFWNGVSLRLKGRLRL